MNRAWLTRRDEEVPHEVFGGRLHSRERRECGAADAEVEAPRPRGRIQLDSEATVGLYDVRGELIPQHLVDDAKRRQGTD